MKQSFWKIELVIPRATSYVFEGALERFSLATSSFEIKGSDCWQLISYSATMPDRKSLTAAIAIAAAAAGVNEPRIICEPLPETDWLAENRASFEPNRLGKFLICPTHFKGTVSANDKVIWLDAATAFGSGEHESTAGCLLMLSKLTQNFHPKRILDLGCGSGILSIAAAKNWTKKIMAVDIDPEAVKVTRANARVNRVRAYVTVRESNGLAGRWAAQAGPFDLIIANILSGPLIKLAANVAGHIERSGLIVLSGLLSHQRSAVLNAYRAHGLLLVKTLQLGDWVTILLKRPERVLTRKS